MTQARIEHRNDHWHRELLVVPIINSFQLITTEPTSVSGVT